MLYNNSVIVSPVMTGVSCYNTEDNTALQDPSDILQLLWRANSFLIQGLRASDGSRCVPLLAGVHQIGVLKPEIVLLLKEYPHVFTVTPSAVFINNQLSTYENRTLAVAEVLQDIRCKGRTVALRSWRNENFAVWGHYGAQPLFEVERAAVALLGIRAYGIHINGYVRGDDGSVAGVWVQKRANDKPTYPGMMDNMVGGGITAGLTAAQVVVKEAEEEASIPTQLAKAAQPVGTVSFLMESERGIHANTEHVYDLELPSGFEPHSCDGEAQGFYYVPTEDLVKCVLDSNYKLSSTPILIDFLIRHGILNSENVPDFPEVLEMLHVSLSLYYRSWPKFRPLNRSGMFTPQFPAVASPTEKSLPVDISTLSISDSLSRNYVSQSSRDSNGDLSSSLSTVDSALDCRHSAECSEDEAFY